MTDTKLVKSTERPKPPAAGRGRKAGSQNKLTKTIKDAILESFDKVGGSKYLQEMAHEQPAAYMTLLGKVLPTQVEAKINTPKVITFNVVGND